MNRNRLTFIKFYGLLFLTIFCFVIVAIENSPRAIAQTRCVPQITDVKVAVSNPSPLSTQLVITIQGNDCDGDTNAVTLRLLNGLGQQLATRTDPINISGAQGFTITDTVVVNGFLGSCTLEITLLDKSGNK